MEEVAMRKIPFQREPDRLDPQGGKKGRKVKDLCREHGIMHGLLLPVEVYVSSSRLTYTSVHCQWAGSIFNTVLYRSSYLSLAGHM